MQTLGHLKKKLDFNKSLDEIINILKVTTSIQLRHLQEEQWGEDAFLSELQNSFSMFKKEDILKNPLIYKKEINPQGIVIITSDEGFLGEFNNLLMQAALREKKSNDDKLIVIGERGAQYLDEMKIPYQFFRGGTKSVIFQKADKLREYLTDKFLKGDLNQIIVIYAEFKSIVSRTIRLHKLLPFSTLRVKNFSKETNKGKDILIEPSQNKVVEGLIKLSLEFALHKIFYSSKLSEFSARLMHLEGSEQELIQINRQLRLEYFKNIHMLADKRLRELLSSRILKIK